ncbi:MAG: L-lactate dehydrogenase [Butyricicoccus sp.]|nr:L-lactate dehydrogenase [Butyricicoccus sp.]
MTNSQKCGIIGCGSVGAAAAYTLATHGLFSELVLIDMNRKRAHGEAMDISHGVAFSQPCRVIDGDYDDLTDASLVIIAAGVGQKPGESRLDLLTRNAAVMRSIITEIKRVCPDTILLIVSNPVDLLTGIALRISGFPPERVIGSGTVLDTARLKFLLGQQLKVDSRNVHAFVIGEHGDSELAVWSSANISGIDLDDYCTGRGISNDFSALFESVRHAAYEIIEGKGATYYGIAMSVLRIATCIVRGERGVLPVSCYADGHYGLNEVCIGLPCVVGRNGIETVLDIPLSDEERSQLQRSAKTLKDALDALEL